MKDFYRLRSRRETRGASGIAMSTSVFMVLLAAALVALEILQ